MSVAALLTTLILLDARNRMLLLNATIFLYVVPGIIYFVWRYSFYRNPLPLPFYIKLSSQYYLSGLPDVKAYVWYLVLHIGALIVVGIFRGNLKLAPTYVSVASFVLFFLRPAHVSGFGWRFLYPVTPVIFVIAGTGLGNLMALLSSQYKRQRIVVIAFFAVLVVLCLGMLRDVRADTTGKVLYAQDLAQAHIALGKFLAPLYANVEFPVVAIGDAGALPYYSHWKTIDTYGLNDNEIARSGKHDPNYVLAMKPDLIVLISSKSDRFEPRLEWERALCQSSLAQGYVRAKSVQFHVGYYLWLMVRPDSVVDERLKAWTVPPNP